MEISLSYFGDLIYTIPTVLFVYSFREWVKSKIQVITEGREMENFLNSVDLLALVCAFFSFIGWGSFLRYRNKDSFISYLFAQIAFLFLIMATIVYAKLKGLEKGGYSYYFIQTLITTAWVGFFVNWIPLPPFDASYFYLKNLLDIRPVVLFLWVYKIFVTVGLVLFFELPPLFQGKFLLKWAGF